MARKDKYQPDQIRPSTTMQPEVQVKSMKYQSDEIVVLEKPGEDKVKFLVWFSKALEGCEEMKPHHMSAIQAFFRDLGLADCEQPNTFEDGLNKFGYRRN